MNKYIYIYSFMKPYYTVRLILFLLMDKELIKKTKELVSKNGKELSKLIDIYLIPAALEKKTNAEVSTPFKLRQEMLDKIPIKFWETTNKVFEPCCGKGGFVIDIVDRFMIGLSESIPDEKTRYKTIVEECLYFADINPTNIFVCKLLLDPYNSYKLNYVEGNTLMLNIKSEWKLDGFDAIIGNPPYNSSGNTGTGNTIWQNFTKISLNDWLLPKGYLCYVHPPGWRKPNTKRARFYGLYDLMTKENQMLYLSIHGIKDGKLTFNCGTRYDWYVIEKINKYKNTEVCDEKNILKNINMGDFNWLPNYNIGAVRKLLTNDSKGKCEIVYSASLYESRKNWVSSIKTAEFKHPCIHSTPKKGIRYEYSKFNDKGHFGISKLIFGEAGINHVIIDINGDYGMTQGAIGIKIKDTEEGERIKKAITSNNFKDILKSCKWGNFRIDWRLFASFKKDFWKELIE